MLFFYNYLYNSVKNKANANFQSNYKKKETFLFLYNVQRERNVPSIGVLKTSQNTRLTFLLLIILLMHASL